ncbi:MAG: ABC transporter ATP-binding protein [Clostridia bacterium]|nr:ABC transporter ATP-binding protein [Clostridia bacterium]
MKQILKYLKPYKSSAIISLILTAVNNAFQILLPAMMSLIINNGIGKNNIDYVRRMGSFMVLFAIISVVLGCISSYFVSKCSMGFGKEIRRAVFVKTQSLSGSDISDISTASLLIRSTNDINQVQTIFQNVIRIIVSAIVMMIGGTVMSFLMNKTLSTILFCVLSVIVVVVFFVSKKIIPMYDVVQQKMDNLNKVLREKLSGIRVVRAFNKSEYEDERFDKSNNELATTYVKINRIYAKVLPIGIMLLFGIIVTLVYINCRQIMALDAGLYREQIANTVGNLQAFIMYVLMIIGAITMATSVLVMIPKAMISVNRINEVLSREPAIKETENTKDFIQRGTVEFRNVTFSYPGDDVDKLVDASFTINEGETVAIIGSTGSGKSTILNLMTRLYDIEKGEILVGGINVKELSRKSLTSSISVAQQKTMLFSGSVKDNVRFGNDEVTDEEIVRVCKKAQADEFVEQLPEKYDTMIYQDGKNLSGGQKQRLTIARALAKKADIYVFDDSFSALDFKTDKIIREALKEELKDKTVIIVAQRIGSVADADRIIVLGEGEIAGIGTHSQLSQDCKLYQEIMKSQLSKEGLENEK